VNNKVLPRIAFVGARGLPANYGGFETFAEEISINLVRRYGYQVTVVCDAAQYQSNGGLVDYKGVQLRYSKFSKGGQALRFYLDSIDKVIEDHDIVYSCGPAGGLFGPLVRRHGKIMMTNPDGLNSKRSKWTWPVKMAFRVFEFIASKFSDWVVCDSKAIEEYIQKSYRCKHTKVAEYGAYRNEFMDVTGLTQNVLSEYMLKPNGYHLVVSRLEPENNVDVILSGYLKRDRKLPIVVIGNLNDTDFVRDLQKMACDNVRFIGGIYNKKHLSILRAHSASYLHGHSVGGTNPSLLEAMGSMNLCICHDNQFNREVVQNCGIYFKDSSDVDECIESVENKRGDLSGKREAALLRVENYYNWENMAAKYNQIFLNAFNG